MLILIDNYDSFTHNLARYFRRLNVDLQIYRNDAITLNALIDLRPTALLISPGPGTPQEAGVSLAAIRYFYDKIPLLGVCLGHQAIAEALGGKIISAERLMHGKTSPIYHTGKKLFNMIPSPFNATRYHSLLIDKNTLPRDLLIDAWTEPENEIMAISHQHLPLFGVQFHPEAILTEHGDRLIANFVDLLR